MRPLRLLTWHVHGNYLWYLSQIPHQIFLPVGQKRPGYGGRGTTFPFGDNVLDIAASDVKHADFDAIVFQHRQNWEEDQFQILSPAQRLLPRIYLEHDPPQQHPTNSRHWVNDPDVLLVHVTAFNQLMWDSGRTPTRVIEHGVLDPDASYDGRLERGIVVINHLKDRGRRLGADVFEQARLHVPLDLVGMQSEELHGLGEIEPTRLAVFEAKYRFFFNPIRYTSLGLAVCEAMLLGMPIIGLATTEMVMTIENGVSGWLDTSLDRLMPHMQRLLKNSDEARALGAAARLTAQRRFHIDRFVADWEQTLRDVTRHKAAA